MGDSSESEQTVIDGVPVAEQVGTSLEGTCGLQEGYPSGW